MEKLKPFVLSVGGWDPSGGAGLAADIKTFETCGTTGMGVCSSITVQTENHFASVHWTDEPLISSQLELLLKQYSFSAVKVGLIENLSILSQIVQQLSPIPVIWDPILKASAGFDFHGPINSGALDKALKNIFLVTPNLDEAKALFGNGLSEQKLQETIIKNQWCNILLKGGHASGHSNDILVTPTSITIIEGENFNNPGKHGSGCVLSSAIASYFANGSSIEESCLKAKKYVEQFIESTKTLLGYHRPVYLPKELNALS